MQGKDKADLDRDNTDNQYLVQSSWTLWTRVLLTHMAMPPAIFHRSCELRLCGKIANAQSARHCKIDRRWSGSVVVAIQIVRALNYDEEYSVYVSFVSDSSR